MERGAAAVAARLITAAESAVIGLPRPLPFVRHTLGLDAAQWLSPKELERVRISRLQALLRHATTHCPYYSETLSPALEKMGGLRSVEQLAYLPIVTREDVRENVTRMLDNRRDSGSLRRSATGGTTGVPMPFFTDREYRRHLRSLVLRVYRTMGRGPFSSTILMAGSPIDIQRWTDSRRRMLYAMRRTTVIPAANITVAGLPSVVAAIQAKSPKFLMCYVSTLRLLAKYCIANGERLRVGAVVPLVELVTSADRAVFDEAFGAEIFELYGAREATGLAVECGSHQGMHIQDDSYVVEFVRSGEPVVDGDVGEVLLTDLWNYAMPLIRYQIGDVGSRIEHVCDCGRSFALMKVTHGRVLDVIVSRQGALVPGEFFPHLFKEVDRDVEAFRVWQKSIDEIEISMVVRDSVDSSLESYLSDRIRVLLGSDIELAFHRVPELHTEGSGKWRPTRSDVPLPW